jgi:hypothetical protein
MTFLELVKQAWTEASQSGSGPASVKGMSGQQAKFVNWVQDAWLQIQSESNEWSFLKANKICSLIPGQESYDAKSIELADLLKPLAAFIRVDGGWAPLNLEISFASSGEFLRVNKGPGRPCTVYFSNNAFTFDTIPDASYQLNIYYKRRPQELTENTDTPYCDKAYHRTIMWHAVKTYASDDDDKNLYQRANTAYEKALNNMLSDLTPPITFGRSKF